MSRDFKSHAGAVDSFEVGTALAIIVAAAAVIAVIWRRPQLTRLNRSPSPGEIWFATVPFEDDWTVHKDRPVLIVAVVGSSLMVRKITSQNQASRPTQYDFLPQHLSGLAKPSWIRKEPERLAASRLRRRVTRSGHQRWSAAA